MVRDESGAVTLFDQVLAQRGFAIFKLDNRGMGNRGRNLPRPRKTGSEQWS